MKNLINRAFAAEKKIFILLAAVMMALGLTGCRPKDAYAAVGHTYKLEQGDGWETIYFTQSGIAEVTTCVHNGSWYPHSHLYSIVDYTIYVYRNENNTTDYFGVLKYSPEEDCLYATNGNFRYERVK